MPVILTVILEYIVPLAFIVKELVPFGYISIDMSLPYTNITLLVALIPLKIDDKTTDDCP